ncbi:LOB domain-containing protein 27-like [Impatiens glandulifera]|uniref:LOB domain-containing protein 27-like n=1 Tax=Impatiens glandulifera TaxID=253017 RepID=UPI001FB18073|nr:LOB domain-containing protein 27-like [Impatiens glandulifera]
MTLKGGTTHACAACKYQRRRCTPKCLLAPYFPADQPKMFQNAHRLFGVSNIVKILKSIDQSQTREAMNSIIFQSNMRDRYPVEGCCYFIRGLQSQIHQTEMELHAVLTQLRLYRQQQQQQTHMQDGSTIIDDCTSNLQLGINALTLYHEQADVNSLPVSSNEQHYTNNNMNIAYNDENNSMWIQHAYPQHNFSGTENNNIMSNNSVLTMQQPLLVSSQHQNIQEEPVQDYDEMHTYFDTIDDKQSYLDSNDASDTSSDTSLKDTTNSFQHVSKKELKNAAACFSLTSVN